MNNVKNLKNLYLATDPFLAGAIMEEGLKPEKVTIEYSKNKIHFFFKKCLRLQRVIGVYHCTLETIGQELKSPELPNSK